MARYTGSVCKLCRREGEKLFLKGDRCFTAKCAMDKRDYPPGQHTRRVRPSDYGIQLREKQKVKRIYGVLESQFRSYFDKAVGSKGVTGDRLLQLLERRLDNTIYRLGWVPSRKLAKQVVTHGHIKVNDHKVSIASYQVQTGDVISLYRTDSLDALRAAVGKTKRKSPGWLSEPKGSKLQAEVLRDPTREEVDASIQEQLIVEYYSR